MLYCLIRGHMPNSLNMFSFVIKQILSCPGDFLPVAALTFSHHQGIPCPLLTLGQGFSAYLCLQYSHRPGFPDHLPNPALPLSSCSVLCTLVASGLERPYLLWGKFLFVKGERHFHSRSSSIEVEFSVIKYEGCAGGRMM